MKSLLVTTFLIASSTALATIPEYQGSSRFTQGVYEGTCFYTRPLYSYEPCNARSAIGDRVLACAFDEAIARCERDGNLDCIRVEDSGRVRRKVSADFPGYLRCQGSVIVRGYRN